MNKFILCPYTHTKFQGTPYVYLGCVKKICKECKSFRRPEFGFYKSILPGKWRIFRLSNFNQELRIRVEITRIRIDSREKSRILQSRNMDSYPTLHNCIRIQYRIRPCMIYLKLFSFNTKLSKKTKDNRYS